MSGNTAEAAGLGKDLNGDKNLPPADQRTAEEVGGTPFDHAAVNRMLDDPSQLEGKSESEIAAMLGVAEVDKSIVIGPSGDAPVHELNRRAEEAAAAPKVETPPAPAAAAPSTAPAAPAPSPPVATPPAEATAAPTVEPVIATRDGRPVIGYNVLQAERQANKDLRQENARLAEQLARGAAPTPQQTPAAPVEVTPELQIDPDEVRLYTPEEIESFRANYPETLVNRWVADNKAAVAAFTGLQEDRAERARESQNKVTESVIDFTDEHPVLSVWAAGATEQDQKLFKAAVAQDNALRSDPEWANAPWQKRMEQAVKNTALIHGVVYTPRGTDAPAPNIPQQSLEQRAQAALAAAAAAPKIPTSHSDLPGGAPAGQSEAENLASYSPTGLEARLEKMSGADMERYLASMA